MKFTSTEKYAIVYILNQLMKADGIIDPNEQVYLENIYEELNITIIDLSYVLDYNFDISKQIIAAMPDDKKTKALTYFNTMAQCDGFIDDRETSMINQFISK